MRGRRSLWLIAVAFAGALLLRVQYLDGSEVEDPFRSDAGQYALYAANLLHHGTFSRELPREDGSAAAPRPDAFRSPGYPAFLALHLWWSRSEPAASLRAVQRSQALLSALLVPLTFALGRSFLPAWAAGSAAVLVALSPHLVTLSGYLLTEVLFASLLLAALALCARAWRRASLPGFAAAGALFGLTSLVNETALAIPPLLAAAGALAVRSAGAPRSGPGRGRGLLALVAASALLPSAWALRNALSLPEGARSGSDRMLATMAHGSYPGWVYRDPRLRYYAYREDPRFPELRGSFRGFARVLGERVRERPLRHLVWYAVEKPATLWSWSILQGTGDIYVYALTRSWYETSGVGRVLRGAMRTLHPWVLLLACLGTPLWAWQLSRPRQDPAEPPVPHWLLAIGVYYTALYTLTAPWPRYAVPLRPELYLWALWSLCQGLAWGRRLRGGRG